MRSITAETGPFSTAFYAAGIRSFDDAFGHIKCLPYRRNKNKEDLLGVFEEQCGTCGTKHALLKQLAIENGWDDVLLYQGIFLMTPANMPKVAPVLTQYNLKGIPEAHNYLRISGAIADATNERSSEKDFIDTLLAEEQILPPQVTTYKVGSHQKFIQQWLKDNSDIPYTPDELWLIREECISALSV